MKLSKTNWVILTLGILVITFVSLSGARFQQVNEQKQGTEELSMAMAKLRLSQSQLKGLYPQQERLEAQLNQSISQIETAKTILSQPNESIIISDAVFRIAEAFGVEVTEISSSSPAHDDLEGIKCSVLPLTTTVRGYVPNLIGFITRLNSDFTTGVVKSAEITIPKPTDNATANAKPSANIRLVIYSYRGK